MQVLTMTKRTQWLAVAIGSGLLAIAGCQSEGRSDVPPASTMATSAQPLVTGMNDAMKTSIPEIVRQFIISLASLRLLNPVF